MQNGNFKSAMVLGFFIFSGLALLGYLAGSSAIKFKEYERTVVVKGLSEKEYPADIAIWPIHFSAANNDLTQLYESIENDTNEVIVFLKTNGFEAQEINKSAPGGVYDKLVQGYEKTKIEFRYSATQTITVYTSKIETVKTTMNKLAQLGKKGIVFSEQGYRNNTEYLFTRLNEVKPSMIEEATTKAREVAEKFAKDSNSKLGKIKKARQGQFTITNRDKNNPHIKKVRVVSTIEYYLSD
ncbi:MAG: SIMPL domain-containing protein [Desulfobacteraceae bacterium]|nr:SIMPL domain-containing protein [Desulfobacteraceae bacterium]